jgi:DNA-binding response OmpR family regulator
MTAKRKILIVEDDPGLRHVHEIFFNYKGFDFSAVNKGTGVVEQVRTEGYDVVILDLGLPDIDGLDVLKALREVSDVPVIVMTARTDTQTIRQCVALGANDYLNKPFRPEILLRRVEAVLANPGARMAPDVVGSL